MSDAITTPAARLCIEKLRRRDFEALAIGLRQQLVGLRCVREAQIRRVPQVRPADPATYAHGDSKED